MQPLCLRSLDRKFLCLVEGFQLRLEELIHHTLEHYLVLPLRDDHRSSGRDNHEGQKGL